MNREKELMLLCFETKIIKFYSETKTATTITIVLVCESRYFKVVCYNYIEKMRMNR